VIFVSDVQEPDTTPSIFISDERNVEDPRIVVAAQYQVLTEPSNNHVALRLQNGVIHSRPDQGDQYQQTAFASYDLKLSLNQSGYSTTEERPSYESIVDRLDQSAWRDPAALRRMIEYYKDLAFPTASLIFCVLGVPVGIVSKRSGRVGGFAVGVLIVVIYYVLNVACEFLVTTLVIPPLAGAWGPNAIFVLVTLWWFYAVGRQ
jgi:lipopolysaccharide export system permease protein